MFQFLPEIGAVISDNRLMPLGPGSPNATMRAALEQLQRDLPGKAKDPDFAAACLAGLWLYHDYLHESHVIIQDLPTVEGKYWHAIMHRREPDYWNAKFWLRRVGHHPIHASLGEEVARWPEFFVSSKWDAAAFVDLCEQHADPTTTGHDCCRKIQRIEWNLLFRYCHECAFA